jgi:hypothetical protein
MNWLVISAIAASVLFGGGVGVVYAADGAVPGDALYGVDTGFEALRLSLTRKPELKFDLALEYAGERLMEMLQLAGEDAPGEALQQALQGFSANLEQAEQAMMKVVAGDGGQQLDALQLMLQEKLSLQTQILAQVREQVSTMNMGQVEQALRIMENTRTRLETMLQQGETHGAPEDHEGGPPEDSPGGPNEDSPQGMPEGSQGEGSESEGQGGQPEEAGQASEGSGFHDGLEELQFQVEQMMALANQGEVTQLAMQATEYGNWVDKLTQLVAEAEAEDPELAEALALLLEEALEGHISGLGSLMWSTSEGVRTCLSQAIAYAQDGHDTVAGMFGHGSQEGHQGEGGQHEDPPGGGGH